MVPRFLIKGLVKVYPARSSSRAITNSKKPVRALDRITLTLHDRTVTGLTGPSGCGKSTLARVLMRIENFQEGGIVYKKKPLKETPIKQFRTDNRLVFPSPLGSVHPYFTVRKILSEPLAIAGVKRTRRTVKIHRLMDLMELPLSLLDRYPSQLSGGQMQRVTMARALVTEPEFIILDEPFSALDHETAERICLRLRDFFKETGSGALLISHQEHHVHTLAGHVYRMDQGRIDSP